MRWVLGSAVVMVVLTVVVSLLGEALPWLWGVWISASTCLPPRSPWPSAGTTCTTSIGWSAGPSPTAS